LVIERVTVYNMGGWGIYVDGLADGSHSVNNIRMVGVDVVANNRGGLFILGCAAPALTNVYALANGVYGIFLDRSASPRLMSCYMEYNGALSTDATYEGQCRIKTGVSASVIGCVFENFSDYTNKTALVLENCYGANVIGCSFINANSVAATKSMNLIDNTKGTYVGVNNHSLVSYAVYSYGPDAAGARSCTDTTSYGDSTRVSSGSEASSYHSKP
jgi:hypothetical protein